MRGGDSVLTARAGTERSTATWPKAGRLVHGLLLHGTDEIPEDLAGQLLWWRIGFAEVRLLLETEARLPGGANLWQVSWWRLSDHIRLGPPRGHRVAYLIEAWRTVGDVPYTRLEVYGAPFERAQRRYMDLLHSLRGQLRQEVA